MKPTFVPLMEGRYTLAMLHMRQQEMGLTLDGHVSVEVLLRAEAGEQFLRLG